MYFKRTIIAISGLFLCLFLIVHLAANSILLLPEEKARISYNAYATMLRENILVKIIAYFLYASIILHTIYALLITLRNRSAKSSRYVVNKFKNNSSWTSQNMGFLGLFVFLFLFVHMANFWARIKLGLGAHVGVDAYGNVDVYKVTYLLFQNRFYVVFYTLLMVPLGFHLHHGLKSAFMTLGLYHKKGLAILGRISLWYATIVTIGFGIIPLVVHFK